MLVDYKNIYPSNAPIVYYKNKWYNFDQWRSIPIDERGGVISSSENLLNRYYFIFTNKWLNINAMGDFSWYLFIISVYKGGVILIERFSYLDYNISATGIPTIWNCIQFVKATPKLKDLPLEETYYLPQVNDQQELIDRIRSIINKTGMVKSLIDYIKDK